MPSQLHAVLGGSSPVGRAVLDELKRRNLPAISIERTHKVEGVETAQADMTDSASSKSALAQATHIYLCIGLPYSLEIWKRSWPAIMENTIAAAEATDARIVFLDNIYMYGPPPLQNPITEEHPQTPSSRKGALRKQIADELLASHKTGLVKALIARSADFYGPHATHSPLYIPLEPMLKGKPALWVGNPDTRHSFTYTPDAGAAMVRLALDDTAFGQVWHLPTSNPPPTTRELIVQMGELIGRPAKVSVLPKFVRTLAAPFVSALKELNEMVYQYESDYIFSSEKFEKQYPDFAVTSYEVGVKAMVSSFRK